MSIEPKKTILVVGDRVAVPPRDGEPMWIGYVRKFGPSGRSCRVDDGPPDCDITNDHNWTRSSWVNANELLKIAIAANGAK